MSITRVFLVLLLVGCGTRDLDPAPKPTSDAAPAPASDATTNATQCRSDSDCPPPGPSNVPWSCRRSDTFSRCGPVEPERVGVACTEDEECGGGNICRAPIEPGDGGSALVCTRAIACTGDGECGGGQVCRTDPTVPPGWIYPSGLVCSAPCASDHDCAPTDKCESGGHCRARTCEECPSYLSCASGTCVVPSCVMDADCPGGYCVAGGCAGSLGVCRLQCL